MESCSVELVRTPNCEGERSQRVRNVQYQNWIGGLGLGLLECFRQFALQRTSLHVQDMWFVSRVLVVTCLHSRSALLNSTTPQPKSRATIQANLKNPFLNCYQQTTRLTCYRVNFTISVITKKMRTKQTNMKL